MKEQLSKTNHDIRQALYHLSRVIDNGDFHIPIVFDAPQTVDLYAGIPKCFKVPVRGLDSPFYITFKYYTLDGKLIEEENAYEDASQSINSMGYGSYSASEPSMMEHDIHYKDPIKIVMKEPTGE